ncbi:transcriptional regulator [Dokdonella sp.]|uniref:winged helix-turn-helix domain-containing protein n=1 Tax=Dokdonella sp. TaxID=2291710 RepID=UPI0025C22CDF|nr:transcriptional regulator [Dokdonella sp.]MBX3689206.1 transcriptional regulator [Dokdonella sp.]
MHYRFECFELHPTARLLRHDQLELEVPRKVFDCLAYLIEHRERAIARDELIDAVWKRSNVSDNQLAHAIAAARRLLGDDGEGQRLIRTVPGFGYHWVGNVDTVAAADIVASPTPLDSDPVDAIQTAPAKATAAPLANPADLPAQARRPTAATATAKANRLRPWLLTSVLLACAAVAVWWSTRADQQAAPTAPSAASIPSQTWVLPGALPDAAESWARIGLMALIAEGLNRQGAAVIPIEKALTRVGDVAADVDLAELARELDAALVVAPRAYQVKQTWVVALAAYGKDSGKIRVDASAGDLLAAGRLAVQRLNQRLRHSGPGLDGSIDETFELISQAIRARDYEGALLQLSRLSDADRHRPEAGLLEVDLELERGQNSAAREKAELWLQRLNASTQPVAYARVLLRKATAMRQLGEADWPGLVDQAIALLQGANSPRDLATAMQLRGIAAYFADKKADAMRDLVRAREMFDEQGDEFRAAKVTGTMGALAVRDGRLGEASLQLAQSAKVLEAYGAIDSLRSNIEWTAYQQVLLLRWADVLRTTDRLRDLLQKAGKTSSYEQSSYLRIRTFALMHLGRLNEAQTLLDEQERAVKRDIQENDLRDRGVDELADIAGQRAWLQLIQHHWERSAATAAAGFSMLQGVATNSVRSVNMQNLLSIVVRAQAGAEPWSESTPMPVLDARQIEILKNATNIDGRVAYAYWNARHGNLEGAEADYRAAFALANATPQNVTYMMVVVEPYTEFLLARKRVRDASQLLNQLLVNSPDLPEQSYEVALLQLRVRMAEGNSSGAKVAARRVLALAGERPLPVDLLPTLEAARNADPSPRH